MPKFNKHLRKKRAYKKCFNGTNTKDLLYFASYVLENDKPDIVIINVGGNNMSKDKPIIVADDIMDIVHMQDAGSGADLCVGGDPETWVSNKDK